MKKRITIVLPIVLATVLLLSACATGVKKPVETGDPTTSNEVISTNAPEETATDPEKKSSFTPYFSFSSRYRNGLQLQKFQNGLTLNFVLFKQDEEDPGMIYLVLMNQKGEILYKLNTGTALSDSDSLDNVFEIIGIGEKIVSFKFRDVYYLLNASGSEIMKSADGAFDRVLAVHGNIALVYKNNGSISSVSQELGTVDSNGNWVCALSKQDIDINDYRSATWIGEVFFMLEWNKDWSSTTFRYDYTVFNYEDGVMSEPFERGDLDYKTSNFSNGKAFYRRGSSVSTEMGVLSYSDKSFTFDPVSINQDVRFESFEGEYAIFSGAVDGYTGDFYLALKPGVSGGIIFDEYPMYSYRTGAAGISELKRDGEYWLLFIIGADNKGYVTIYRDGQFDHNPVSKETCLGDIDNIGILWFRNQTFYYWEKAPEGSKYVWMDIHGNRVNEVTVDFDLPVLFFEDGVDMAYDDNGPYYIDMTGQEILRELTDISK